MFTRSEPYLYGTIILSVEFFVVDGKTSTL